MKRKLTAILAGIALMLCMPLCTSADTEIDRDEAQRMEKLEPVARETAPVPGDAEEAPLALSEQIDYKSSEVTSGDFKYTTKTDSDGKVTATITGFAGEESGDLVIPGEIDGYTVTEIGNFAFRECSGFTGTLAIPDSITNIGLLSFSGCNGFTGDLIIPDSVITIGCRAFYACNGFNGMLTIADSVISIGDYAFYNCSSLRGSLTIPNSVTYIGESAFAQCKSFTGSLIIPDSVTEIGDCAFSNCSGFNGTLTLPHSIISIGKSAFYNCSNIIGSLIIPDSITFMDDMAFADCSSLNSIYFLGNVPERWGDHVFSSYLSSKFIIYYPEGNTSGWTSPTWTAPDGSVYNTATFVPGTETVPGDINGDGVFDYMDISRLYYLYTEDTFEADEALCDYNGDGVFDYYDITKLYADFRKIM